MAVRDIFKISRKTFFNPSGWIDYEGLKRQNKTIYRALKALFTRQKAANEETFDQAMARLQVTEDDIQKSAKAYRYYALIFVIVGILLMGYSFFLLFHKIAIVDWILGMAGSAFLFAQAFRFDFWSLQIRRRQLGLTFDDWKRSILGDKGASR